MQLQFEDQLQNVISKAIEKAIAKLQTNPPKDWMSLKEGAMYANVSPNTFKSFRLKGLKIFEEEGVKRVSKEEIDNFLKSRSS